MKNMWGIPPSCIFWPLSTRRGGLRCHILCHRGSSPATFASKHQAPTWRVETSETAIASRTRRKRPRRVERAKKDAQGLDKSGELWSPLPLSLSALRPAKRMYRIFGGSSLPQARRLLFLKDEPGRGLRTFSFSPSSGLVFCIPPPSKIQKSCASIHRG